MRSSEQVKPALWKHNVTDSSHGLPLQTFLVQFKGSCMTSTRGISESDRIACQSSAIHVHVNRRDLALSFLLNEGYARLNEQKTTSKYYVVDFY
jgi:hypothetical protein